MNGHVVEVILITNEGSWILVEERKHMILGSGLLNPTFWCQLKIDSAIVCEMVLLRTTIHQ